MRRAARIAKGLGAFVFMVVLVGAIPWALWHFVGWPLPHHVPSTSQIGRALNHQGIPDQVLVDALAVVVWVTWASLIASLAVEVPAALSGRHASRLPLAGAFQPFTGKLVAAVIVACLAVAPRPVHAGAVGVGGSLGGLRPTATLTAPDATLTASPGPLATVTETAAIVAPPVPAASASAPAPETYLVQRGDTLWGIAQRELGDPLRWSEIYQLNEGRPQSGGVTLGDPHWIDPGWTLLLPPTAPVPAVAPAPTSAPPTVSAQGPSPRGDGEPASAPTTTTTTPISGLRASPTPSMGPTSSSSPSVPADSNGSTTSRRKTTSTTVRLPSGSVVAGSFAAGVLSAVALGRLRRRHAYRYQPPQPGRDLSRETLAATVRQLADGLSEQEGNDDPPVVPASPLPPEDEPDHRERPDYIEVGERAGKSVKWILSSLSGIVLQGERSGDVVRAWLAALLVRAGPVATDIVTTESVLGRLLPGLHTSGGPSNPVGGSIRGVRTLVDREKVLKFIEVETLTRSRILHESGASDVVDFRRQNPWEPLPAAIAVMDYLTKQEQARLELTLERGARLGIGLILLDVQSASRIRLDLDSDCSVISADPDEVGAVLTGVRLFGLRPSEAAEVVATLSDSEQRPDCGDIAIAEDEAAAESRSSSWPDLSPLDVSVDAPISVRVFGPYEILVDGELVATGLRSSARELLAWYLLHPEGSSVEAAVEALWPETDPTRVHKQFWVGAANLRTRLGNACDPPTRVLGQVGDAYRLDVAAIECDLWQFQSALRDAAETKVLENARDSLHRAVSLYRGDFAVGADYLWIEAVRQDLHRRALDAHLRLAEIEEQLGASDAAAAVLESAIELDRYAEEPYRRLMSLQARELRKESVVSTWRLLQRRLGEIDVDPEPETVRVYGSLASSMD